MRIAILLILVCCGDVLADPAIPDVGYLCSSRNPVKVELNTAIIVKMPIGTKLKIIDYSIEYQSAYLQQFKASLNRQEKQVLEKYKSPSACLSNNTCKKIIVTSGQSGRVMDSFKKLIKYGESIKHANYVKVINGPYAKLKAWVKVDDFALFNGCSS